MALISLKYSTESHGIMEYNVDRYRTKCCQPGEQCCSRGSSTVSLWPRRKQGSHDCPLLEDKNLLRCISMKYLHFFHFHITSVCSDFPLSSLVCPNEKFLYFHQISVWLISYRVPSPRSCWSILVAEATKVVELITLHCKLVVYLLFSHLDHDCLEEIIFLSVHLDILSI